MKIAIIRVGRTIPALVERRGDFERWFADGMGLPETHWQLVDVRQGDPLPEPGELAGVVVTGATEMVTERADWSERTGVWLRSVVEHRTHLLAVCYGHQLLADAMGGEVGNNPHGRQIGTQQVRLHPLAQGDALFSDFPPELGIQVSHVQSVLRLPAGAELLGRTEVDPHHVFRLGNRAWGVQFHPEFDADIMRGYVRGRRPKLEAEGLDADRLEATVLESDHGPRLLRRFAKLATGSL